MGTLTI